MNNMEKLKPIVLKCKRCKHQWIRRLERNPVECPKCKQRTWNKEVQLKK